MLYYGRGYEKLYAAPVAVLYPECATQMCELIAQGRARVVIRPRDISRITVEKSLGQGSGVFAGRDHMCHLLAFFFFDNSLID